MTGNLIAYEKPKLVAEPTAKPGAPAPPFVAEQNEPSVYAAYWQARSGFFNLTLKQTTASIDLVRSVLP